MPNPERVRIVQEIADAEKYLFETRNSFVEHILKSHGGIPATTCHRCLTFQQGIQSNDMFIMEAQRELAKINS